MINLQNIKSYDIMEVDILKWLMSTVAPTFPAPK